jgi:hypothetical protein
MRLNQVENLESIPNLTGVENVVCDYQMDASMIGICLWNGELLRYWWQTSDNNETYVVVRLTPEQENIIAHWLNVDSRAGGECPDLPDEVIVGKFTYDDCDWDKGTGVG